MEFYFYKDACDTFNIHKSFHQMISQDDTILQGECDTFMRWKRLRWHIGQIESLFYLLKEILKLVSFSFLNIPGTYFQMFFINFRIFLVLSYLIFSLQFRIYLVLCFFDTLLSMASPSFYISFYILSIYRSIFHILSDCFMDSLFSYYLLLTIFFLNRHILFFWNFWMSVVLLTVTLYLVDN